LNVADCASIGLGVKTTNTPATTASPKIPKRQQENFTARFLHQFSFRG
jgi:hypothetical protein